MFLFPSKYRGVLSVAPDLSVHWIKIRLTKFFRCPFHSWHASGQQSDFSSLSPSRMWNVEWDETNVDPTSSLLNHEPPNQHPTIPTCSLKPRFNISSASSRTNILISAQFEFFSGHAGTKGTRSQMSMHDMSNTVDICRYLYGMCMCVCTYMSIYVVLLYWQDCFRVSFCQFSRQKVKTRWASPVWV